MAGGRTRLHIGAMTQHQTPLERAFDLARSGEYTGMGDIKVQLKAEGYQTAQLEGPSLSKQLRTICAAAKAAA